MAQQMANVIQNISQKRTDKRITQTDFTYAFAVSHQTMYPGKTMYYSGKGHGIFHLPLANIYCVKGIENGKASCLWRAGVWTNSDSVISPETLLHDVTQAGVNNSIINYKTNASASEIYPNLKIDSGEIKVIVELFSEWNTYFKDNVGNQKSSLKEALGLYAITPKCRIKNPYAFFNTVVVFIPKMGLFSEDPPQ